MGASRNEKINNRSLKNRTYRLVIILFFATIFMFGFGYALVPLYNVLCSALGVNGKTGGPTAIAAVNSQDLSRTITIQFLATNNANLPWQFRPVIKTITLHPGENKKIAYYAKNESDHTMIVQAIPSVSPGLAAKYLKKTECFCFRRQTLKSNVGMEWPVLFHIDRDLPKDIHEITLSYTLFDVTNMKPKSYPNNSGKLNN